MSSNTESVLTAMMINDHRDMLLHGKENKNLCEVKMTINLIRIKETWKGLYYTIPHPCQSTEHSQGKKDHTFSFIYFQHIIKRINAA